MGSPLKYLANLLSLDYADSGSAPALTARGVDANIDIDLKPKGTGCVRINGGPCITPGGAGEVLKATSVFTPTQIHTLGASGSPALEVVPAPGAGRAILPLYASISCVGADYVAGGSGVLSFFFFPDTEYGLGHHGYFETGASLDGFETYAGLTSTMFFAGPLSSNGQNNPADWDNMPLSIGVFNQTFSGGTKDVTVTVWYMLVDVA